MSLRGKTLPDPADQHWIDLVAEHGHAMVMVADAVDEPTGLPEFAYSMGAFESYGAPELILFGLDRDDAAAIINGAMDDYVAGRRFELGVPEHGLIEGDIPIVFHEADPGGARAFATHADWYYERAPFPLWQIVWPAKNGSFPWEAACPADVRRLQVDLTGGKYWAFEP